MDDKKENHEISTSTPPLGGRGADIKDQLELRSEDVQEILGKTPTWILRRGISLLAVIVIILIAGSWFFKYPEIISSPLVLTTSTPPAGIVAKTSGKIVELRITDQQLVKTGECLAIIESPALYDDIQYLEIEIQKMLEKLSIEEAYRIDRKNLKLGTIQSGFSSILLHLENYNKFIELNYYPRKIASVKKLISANQVHYQNVLKQKSIIEKQHALNKRSYERDAYLKNQNLISEEESDKAKGQLLQSDMSIENINSNLENLKIQTLQMEEDLVDVEQQYLEKRSALLLELNTSASQLQNEMLSWKMTYLLSSPLDGKVTFTNYWSENQNLSAGQVAFTVVPEKQSELIGKALLPAARSGKVKIGQRVNVHFINYPDNEFGMVVGIVSRISLIPTEGNYNVEIKFPNGLLTTYGKELPLSHEMAANAEIITDDLRLIEQFFLPLKKIFKNNI